MTDTDQTRLPKGVNLTAAGRYRVRIKTADVWHSGGSHGTAEAAIAALVELKTRLGVVERVKPPPRMTIHPPPRNIRPTASGWTVAITRGAEYIYGGHYRDLVRAVAARDALELKYPAGSPGRLKGKT